MPWWAAPWAQWLGWTLLFALVVWGVQVAQAFLGERQESGGLSDLLQIVVLLVPLLAAFLIGARLRTWWWALGPPLAIVLLMGIYPLHSYFTMPAATRRPAIAGLVVAMATILLSALAALLAAAAGVWLGKARVG